MKRAGRWIAVAAAVVVGLLAGELARGLWPADPAVVKGLIAAESPEATVPAPLGLRPLPTARVDTPPPLRAARGWPFEDLPSVIKFVALPTPVVAMPLVPPSLYRAPAVARVDRPVPVARTDSVSGIPWLLLPAALGVVAVAVDDGDIEGGDDEPPPPPPPGVVPEPASFLLLGTGLILLGVVWRRRRTPRPGPGAADR